MEWRRLSMKNIKYELYIYQPRHKWNKLVYMGMFGWHENSEIVIVFIIEIITVQSNANLLFRNSENRCCSAILRGR
jgi:hypothetical protein